MTILPQTKSNYRSIPNKVIFYFAWRNITTKRLRSFLTLIGIIIGIGAIYFLLSFGLGLKSIVSKEIIGNQSVRAIDITSPNSRILTLSYKNVNIIQALPHVSSVSRSFSFPGTFAYNGSQTESVVYGIDGNYESMTAMSVSNGRLLNDKDTTTAVINTPTLKAMALASPASAIGRTLRLQIETQDNNGIPKTITKDFKIVGVMPSGTGTEVYIPKFVFESAGIPAYSDVKVLATDTAAVPGLRQQIESLGFQTTSPLDTVAEVNQIFKYFNLILLGFGMTGMIVAVLGMFNTLTISLLERTKEIGLMISIGGRHKDMRKLFIYEALLLSVIGSVSAILLATILGQIINAFLNHFAKARGVTQSFSLFASPPWLIAAMIGFMALVGLIVVYFPARRAEKIDPISALQSE